jgi:Prealbumin-like fold domain
MTPTHPSRPALPRNSSPKLILSALLLLAATLSAPAQTPTPQTTPPPPASEAAPSATLSIVSGFAPQPDTPNPLAGHPFTLLRTSMVNIVIKSGVTIPPDVPAGKFLGDVCATRTPDCQKIVDAIKANVASAVRADANGAASFPALPPGTYYLMIATRYNDKNLVWSHAIQLKPGPNSLTLDEHNAAPVN